MRPRRPQEASKKQVPLALFRSWPPRGPKRPPRRLKRPPRGRQEGPKTAQDGPKTPPRRPKTAPRRPQDGPRRPQDGPRVLQDGFRKPQERPKRAPRGGGRDRHFGLPARRDPQETPRGSQEAPKRPARCLKMPPGSPQKRPRGPRHCLKRAPGWLETPRQSVTTASGQHGNQHNAGCRHPLLCCSLSRNIRFPDLAEGFPFSVPLGGSGAGPPGTWPRPRAERRRKTAEDGRPRPQFGRTASGRQGRPQDGLQDGP